LKWTGGNTPPDGLPYPVIATSAIVSRPMNAEAFAKPRTAHAGHIEKMLNFRHFV